MKYSIYNSILLLSLLVNSACTQQKKEDNPLFLNGLYKEIQKDFTTNHPTANKYYSKDVQKDSLLLKDIDWEKELAFIYNFDFKSAQLKRYTKTTFEENNSVKENYQAIEQDQKIQEINLLFESNEIQKINLKVKVMESFYELYYNIELVKNIGYLIEGKQQINFVYTNQFRIETIVE